MTDYDVQHEFGLRVRENRKKQGLTQEQLSEAIGKSVDTISNIERGFMSTRIKTASEIAATLGVPLADLFYVTPRSEAEKEHEQSIRELMELADRCDPRALEALIQIAAILVELTERSSDA